MTGAPFTDLEAAALQSWAQVPDNGVLAAAFTGLASATIRSLGDGYEPTAHQVRSLGAAALIYARRLEPTVKPADVKPGGDA